MKCQDNGNRLQAYEKRVDFALENLKNISFSEESEEEIEQAMGESLHIPSVPNKTLFDIEEIPEDAELTVLKEANSHLNDLCQEHLTFTKDMVTQTDDLPILTDSVTETESIELCDREIQTGLSLKHKSWSQSIMGYRDFKDDEEFISATLYCHQCNFENRMIMSVENDVEMEVPSTTWYTDHEKHSIKMKNRQKNFSKAMSKYSANARLFNKDIMKTKILSAKGDISEEEAMNRIVGFLSKKVKSKAVRFSSKDKDESCLELSDPLNTKIPAKMNRAMVRPEEAKSAKADW